jgi:hypothetical protein
MEAILDREQERVRAGASLREAWDKYGLAESAGQRDGALAELARCIELATSSGARAEYERLREDLERRLLQEGHVTLRRGDETTIYTGRFPVWLGREGASGLSLRDPGISRKHARIETRDGRMILADCDSRNGTRLGGVVVGGELPLPAQGEIALGESCALRFEVDGVTLRLVVQRGVDRGLRLWAQLSPFDLGPGIQLSFSKGRPSLFCAGGALTLNGKRAASEIQLLRGDKVEVGGAAWEVL